MNKIILLKICFISGLYCLQLYNQIQCGFMVLDYYETSIKYDNIWKVCRLWKSDKPGDGMPTFGRWDASEVLWSVFLVEVEDGEQCGSKDTRVIIYKPGKHLRMEAEALIHM